MKGTKIVIWGMLGVFMGTALVLVGCGDGDDFYRITSVEDCPPEVVLPGWGDLHENHRQLIGSIMESAAKAYLEPDVDNREIWNEIWREKWGELAYNHCLWVATAPDSSGDTPIIPWGE